MTPFDRWYSANIAPLHEEILKSYPASAREQMRKASRESMAACWNAALDGVVTHFHSKFNLDALRSKELVAPPTTQAPCCMAISKTPERDNLKPWLDELRVTP